MKTTTSLKQGMMFAAMIAVFACCKKDKDIDCPPGHIQVDDQCIQEQELITTLELHFVRAPKDTTTFAFKDTDGPGGNAQTIDTVKLDTNATYTVLVEVLDESKTPAENITEEIKEEDHEHLFCYKISDVNTTITRTDSDGTFEVGLESEWVTGAASTGTVTVTLKHQPGGEKDGTCAPGDTDLEVDFPVVLN